MGICICPSRSERQPHHSVLTSSKQELWNSRAFSSSSSRRTSKIEVRNSHHQRRGPVGLGKLVTEDLDAPTAKISHGRKSKTDRSEISRALHSHFIFYHLPQEDLELVIDEMILYSLKPNETIFEEGESGSNCFIISRGSVEILVGGCPKKVLHKGSSFGEIVLMHDSKRTETAITLENTKLWGIDRLTFRNAIESISKYMHEENRRFLEMIPIFAVLTSEEKEKLLGVSIIEKYAAGETIVLEGDPGELLYIIKEGVVTCTMAGKFLREMHKFQYFGEEALLYDTVRTATVEATVESTVISIGRVDLIHVLGDRLKEVMYKNCEKIGMEKSRALKCLNESEIDQIAVHMTVKSYTSNQIVASKYEYKNKFLRIVMKGGLKLGDYKFKQLQCIGDLEILEEVEEEFGEDLISKGESDIAEIEAEEIEIIIGCSLKEISEKSEAILILKQIELFRPLPEHKMNSLVAILQLKNFEDQELIFEENDPGNAFYIVKEGTVDILKNGVFIRSIGSNDYFGERSILLNENRTATAQSRGSSTCWVLSKIDFLNLIEAGIRTQLLKRMELQDDSIEIKDLHLVKLVGKGMFGNVYLTVHKAKKIPYALKTVSRRCVEVLNFAENLVLERKILLEIDHPFIVKLVKTFKDDFRLYFLMEFVQGHDLFHVIRILNLLNETQARFYTACLILIIEHLHSKMIIYRDFKPENIMVDEDGYPKLIDFGTAKIMEGRTYTLIGTPHYMAPEVILGKGYGLAADYWSLGIILYEFVCGGVPFGEDFDNPVDVYKQILEIPLVYPEYISRNNRTIILIEPLLSKNPAMRGSCKSIKENPFFGEVDWDRLLGKEEEPPCVPKLKNLGMVIEEARGGVDELMEVMLHEELEDNRRMEGRSSKKLKNNWDIDF